MKLHVSQASEKPLPEQQTAPPKWGGFGTIQETDIAAGKEVQLTREQVQSRGT